MKHHLLLPGPFGVASRSLCGALTTIFSSFTHPDGSQMPHSSSGHSLFHRPSLPREVSHQVAASMPHFSSRALLKPLCVFSFLNSFLPSRFLGATFDEEPLASGADAPKKHVYPQGSRRSRAPGKKKSKAQEQQQPRGGAKEQDIYGGEATTSTSGFFTFPSPSSFPEDCILRRVVCRSD